MGAHAAQQARLSLGRAARGDLACAITLRPGRRSFLTSALAEGFVAIVAFWALLVVFKAASLAGLIAPFVAAWGPVAIIALVALAAVRLFAR